MTSADTLSFYARHGELTDPKGHRAALDELPSDVAALCRTIQGVLIHDHFGHHLYGPPPAAFRRASRETLSVSRRLDAILAADDRPIDVARQPFARSVGTCRDFALMLCAVLRQRAIPARVRCGFARYFDPPNYEDHWICEYWLEAEQRWAMADAQLDEPQRSHLSIDFDTADIPTDRFIHAWQAWRICRSGTADPSRFGHGANTGAWFLRVNLARDLLSLRKQEVSAWDDWRATPVGDRMLDADATSRCDEMAEVARAADGLSPPDRCNPGPAFPNVSVEI